MGGTSGSLVTLAARFIVFLGASGWRLWMCLDRLLGVKCTHARKAWSLVDASLASTCNPGTGDAGLMLVHREAVVSLERGYSAGRARFVGTPGRKVAEGDLASFLNCGWVVAGQASSQRCGT